MALIWKDRVKETSTTTGTGTYTLAGAATGFQSFSAIGDGNTCYYSATDGTDWEVGIGTYTSAGTTLARTSVIASSNSGSAVNWAAGTRTIFVTAPAAWMRKYSPGDLKGMRVSYVSATAIAIEAGGARDSTDTYDLVPAAATSVSIATAGAINGLDETTLTATATTTGASASVAMTASLWVETPMTATVRTGTGTITGAGTTITGTSTLFTSELRLGDLIRSTSTGAARVTAIASDTSLTIAAAFPGGSPAGSGFTIYENLTIQPNTAVAADKFRVNTVTHAGTTIVMSAAISSGAGASKVAKVGVEVASCWYYPFAVYGSSGHGYLLSTQRTRPYGVTGYTTAWRRVGAYYNKSTGDFADIEIVGTSLRTGHWKKPQLEGRFLTGGSATARTIIEAGCSPMAHLLWFNGINDAVLGGTAKWALVSPTTGTADDLIAVSLVGQATASGCVRIEAGELAYYNTAASGSFYLDATAWLEIV